MTNGVGARIASHYAPKGLRQQVEALVTAAGRAGTGLAPAELAGIDEFHVQGEDATRGLAARMELEARMHVLDVASGLGGSARFLASEYGCRVTGIDFAEDYVQTARLLTELTGLAELVDFQQGDATALPFDEASFDAAWTQHAQQNIADKARFFAELYRVCRPGGRCAMHDLMVGRTGAEPTFPAYWGGDPSVSFLIGEDETKRLLVQVGFEMVDWRDTTRDALEWHEMLMSEPPPPAPVPGLDLTLLFGDEMITMSENAITDLRSGAIGIFEAVLARPS